MTEGEARDAVAAIAGSKGVAMLDQMAALVIAENARQNLIAKSTIDEIWQRHILDSIQLLQWQGDTNGPWLDVGTGGGFPGLAIASVIDRPVVLVEPRARRASFLRDAATSLALDHVSVQARTVEAIDDIATPAVITARAVARPSDILAWTVPIAGDATRWLLQRGASWQAELADTQAAWKGTFHVEHSLSNRDGRIVIVTGATRR